VPELRAHPHTLKAVAMYGRMCGEITAAAAAAAAKDVQAEGEDVAFAERCA
jgi:hypothetical protein